MQTQWRFCLALGAAALLTAAAVARGGCRSRPPEGGRLFTVVSVAGLSWERVTPLYRRGLLPGLRKLMARGGAGGDVMARDFPTRHSILASLVTGRWPHWHRITQPDDLAEAGDDGARIPVWRRLAAAG